MATHYIDYERRSASRKRQGVLRIAAVATSILLASGYVIYRVRATPPPPRVRVMSRVATIPVTNAVPSAPSLSLASTQPGEATTRSPEDKSSLQPANLNSDQQILMSSSKSGAIIPLQRRVEQRPPLTLESARLATPTPAPPSAVPPDTQPAATQPSNGASFNLKP